MTKTRRTLCVCRSFFLLALCLCIIIVLYTQPVKSSAAYVTSLSTTCVNIFTGEGNSEPPTSYQPDSPPSPSTGDSLHIAPYLAVMLFSLATVAVLFDLRRKRNDMIHENQKRRTERTKQ